MVKARYPLVEKVQYNQILARIWRGLTDADREKYQKKAGKTVANTPNNTNDHNVIKQDLSEQQIVTKKHKPIMNMNKINLSTKQEKIQVTEHSQPTQLQ